jgi:hypothetical protein
VWARDLVLVTVGRLCRAPLWPATNRHRSSAPPPFSRVDRQRRVLLAFLLLAHVITPTLPLLPPTPSSPSPSTLSHRRPSQGSGLPRRHLLLPVTSSPSRRPTRPKKPPRRSPSSSATLGLNSLSRPWSEKPTGSRPFWPGRPRATMGSAHCKSGVSLFPFEFIQINSKFSSNFKNL